MDWSPVERNVAQVDHRVQWNLNCIKWREVSSL